MPSVFTSSMSIAVRGKMSIFGTGSDVHQMWRLAVAPVRVKVWIHVKISPFVTRSFYFARHTRRRSVCIFTHPLTCIISTYVVPNLHILPQTQYIKPCALIRVYNAEVFSKCWTPMIRSWRLRILLEFGNTASLKNVRTLRNLGLHVTKGRWRLWSWLRGFYCLKLTSRCWRTLIQTNSKQQRLDRESSRRLLAMRR